MKSTTTFEIKVDLSKEAFISFFKTFFRIGLVWTVILLVGYWLFQPEFTHNQSGYLIISTHSSIWRIIFFIGFIRVFYAMELTIREKSE
jgi:hypothetical protein